MNENIFFDFAAAWHVNNIRRNSIRDTHRALCYIDDHATDAKHKNSSWTITFFFVVIFSWMCFWRNIFLPFVSSVPFPGFTSHPQLLSFDGVQQWPGRSNCFLADLKKKFIDEMRPPMNPAIISFCISFANRRIIRFLRIKRKYSVDYYFFKQMRGNVVSFFISGSFMKIKPGNVTFTYVLILFFKDIVISLVRIITKVQEL